MIDFTSKFERILNKANDTYHNSVDKDELILAHKSLSPIIKAKDPEGKYQELITNANGLSIRIGIKRIALDAIKDNLECDLEWSLEKLTELEGSANEKGFSKTSALAVRVKNLITSLQWIYAQSMKISASYLNDRGRNSESIVIKAKEQYGELYKECDTLPTEADVFAGVYFLDIHAETREFIDSLIEEAEGVHKRLTSDRISERINGIINSLPSEWKIGYSFCPTVSNNNNKMMLVLTPFKNEFSFLAYSYARQNGARATVIDVNSKVFGGCLESDINAIFEYLGTTADVLAITGLAMYHDDNKPAILRALYKVACSKKGIGVFIHDYNSTLSLWSELEDALPKAYDVYYMYLKLPSFRATVDAIKDASVREIDEIFIKKCCAYLGYVGVNEIIQKLKEDYTCDYTELAEQRSLENYSKILTYIMNLKSQAQLVDSSWGISFDCFEDKSFEPRKEFGGYDYDTKRILNPQNLKLIIDMENILLPAKCGLAVNYCLLCGDDSSVWKELSREDQHYRLTIANKTVAKLLNTQYDPEVVIKSIEGKAGAYCSGGGKQIVYSEASLNNYSWLAETVCHEMFHAFQHTAVQGGWKRWYASELMVNEQRVAEWGTCGQKYISIDENQKAYEIQGYEVDARVFAAEAMDGLSKHWSKLKLL